MGVFSESGNEYYPVTEDTFHMSSIVRCYKMSLIISNISKSSNLHLWDPLPEESIPAFSGILVKQKNGRSTKQNHKNNHFGILGMILFSELSKSTWSNVAKNIILNIHPSLTADKQSFEKRSLPTLC